MEKAGFHDDTFIGLHIEHRRGDCRVVLEAADHETRQRYRVRFERCDWVATDCIGLVANETAIIDIAELPWSEVPPRYAVNRACTLYEIQLSGGSSCRVLTAQRIIEAVAG